MSHLIYLMNSPGKLCFHMQCKGGDQISLCENNYKWMALNTGGCTFFFFLIKLSIFFLFASLGLCCSMQVFSSCGSWVFQFLCGFLVLLQHVGSQFPNQQSNSFPALEDGFLTTGPLEKSPGLLLWGFLITLFIYFYFGCARLLWLCRLNSSCGQRGLLFRCSAQSSLAVEHKLSGTWTSDVGASRLQNTAPIVVVQGLSCSSQYVGSSLIRDPA